MLGTDSRPLKEQQEEAKKYGAHNMTKLFELNCVNLNYWQVSFNKTEYYVAFNIVLNLIFFFT